MDELKVWKCKHGHVMGVVARNGDGIRLLLVYRHAINQDIAEGMPEPDVMMILEGYAPEIRCSVCDEIRTWIPGEEHLRQLTERVVEGRSNA